ncbi:hypothetical protein B566_EDAN005347 [Ephemera danica]|nr:hypothetical protein B566_EDAN005347 [Ephemera danica]
MRCAVWEAAATQSKSSGTHGSNTDLELWKDSNALVVANTVSHPSPTALQPVPATVPRGNVGSFATTGSSKADKIKQQRVASGGHCNASSRSKKGGVRSGENSTSGESEASKCSSTSAATKEDALSNMQRFKAECRPETLLPLQTRCEGLVWDCLAGLITNLTTDDSDDHGLAREGSMSQPSSPTLQARGMYNEDDPEYYTENVGGAGGAQGEHYIYVTYPPELKRRLMESCYNRTTRL